MDLYVEEIGIFVSGLNELEEVRLCIDGLKIVEKIKKQIFGKGLDLLHEK